MKKWNVFVLFFICTQIKAQTQPAHSSTVGFEVDLLPYLTGGYSERFKYKAGNAARIASRKMDVESPFGLC